MAIEQLMQAVLTATPAKRKELERVLKGESNTPSNANEEKRLVSIAGTARLLALGRNTVYRLIQTGRLDTVELNGCQRVTMKSINSFVNGERPANEKTEELIAAEKARYAKKAS